MKIILTHNQKISTKACTENHYETNDSTYKKAMFTCFCYLLVYLSNHQAIGKIIHRHS